MNFFTDEKLDCFFSAKAVHFLTDVPWKLARTKQNHYMIIIWLNGKKKKMKREVLDYTLHTLLLINFTDDSKCKETPGHFGIPHFI